MKTRFCLGVALSAIFVLVLVRQTEFAKLATALNSVSFVPLAAAVVALCATQIVKSWRWKYLLATVKPLRASDLLSPTVIGAMTDMILPARTGEVVRAYLVGRKEQIGTTTPLASIVVEKVFDLLIVLLIAASLLLCSSLSLVATLPSEFTTGVLIVVVVVIATAIVLGLLAFRRAKLLQSMACMNRYLPKAWGRRIVETLSAFTLGLQSMRSSRSIAAVALLSITLWAIYASSNFLIIRSFDLQLPLYASLLVLVFQILGVTLPSSPGFIGAYHAAVVAGFSVLHVEYERALSIAVVMHAAFFFPFVAWGLFLVWRENLSLGILSSVQQHVDTSN